ncbi:MAG: IS66 family transposase [Elusimicrobiota bacterium]
MNIKKEVILLREENKQLKGIIEKQNKLIEELQERLKKVEFKLKKKYKPDFIKTDVKRKKKKTGRKKGHEGSGRRSPEDIHEEKYHELCECPECGGKNLSDVQKIRERVTTDIPEKQEAINTKHLIERKYCRDCKKVVEARVPEALPNSQFALRLMIFVMYLKITMRLPSNKVTELMWSMYRIKISDGEVYRILEQLSEAFGDYYEELKQKIINAKMKNIDETGHRVNGINHWLWVFINKEVALYEISRKRNNDVPTETLGNQEGKFFGSDRHILYNKFKKRTGAKQQICETHALRNSKDLADYHPEAKYVHKRLKTIFRKAKEGRTSKEQLLKWIDRIATSRIYTSSIVYKFVRSICKDHREDLFRFVDEPGIDSSNNIAERGLRHPVVMRKISHGNRSQKGADITKRLLSVTETVKLNHSSPLAAMGNILNISK